jgi:radical SAM protein with 4Fe4S-binding SPASM domain
MDSFFLCYFETTRRCNRSCRYCMSRLPGPARRPELDTSECKRLVLDEIRKVSSDAAVAFSGGEHLLRPDAYELLGYAASIGLWSFVNTNGRLLVGTDAAARAAEATGGRVIFVLPLNSIESSVQEWSRDDEVSTVLAAAEACRAAGAPHFFLVTISRQNMGTLKKTFAYLAARRIPVLRAPFVPRGAGAGFRELMFDRNDMRDLIHPALAPNPLAYVSFTPFFASPERMRRSWESHRVRIGGLGCQAGRAFAAVGAEGGVTPCVQLLDSACVRGDVRERPLAEIIRSDPVFEALRTRDSLKGKCGRCRYRLTCGGCRALAFYRSGDILAEDDTCFFDPASPDERSPLEPLQSDQVEMFASYARILEPWKAFF